MDWRYENLDIPFLDLKLQYDHIKDEVKQAIEEVLQSCEFILGPHISAFEKEIPDYLGVKHAIGVGNGTDALVLILDALGIGHGDEVIAVPYTFFASAECVSHVGGRPIFVDAEPITLTLDPQKIEVPITSRTKAIIPVHIFGKAADMSTITDIACDLHLSVVEDACQSMEADLYGRKLGAFGDVGVFFFFPIKNLGAYGDGGLIVTNNDGLAERMRVLRAHGSKIKYHNEMIGYNSRLDEIQADILRAKLPHLDNCNQKQRNVAEKYNQLLDNLPIQLPNIGGENQQIFHLYNILSDQRDELREFLKSKGIETGIYYPLPLHLQPAYQSLGYKKGSLPISEVACERNLSLPMYPELNDEQIEYVAMSVREFFERRK